MIGTRWVLAYQDEQPLVRVVAEETSHVLVEFEDVENQWGGPERRWLSKGSLLGPLGIRVESQP